MDPAKEQLSCQGQALEHIPIACSSVPSFHFQIPPDSQIFQVFCVHFTSSHNNLTSHCKSIYIKYDQTIIRTFLLIFLPAWLLRDTCYPPSHSPHLPNFWTNIIMLKHIIHKTIVNNKQFECSTVVHSSFYKRRDIHIPAPVDGICHNLPRKSNHNESRLQDRKVEPKLRRSKDGWS